MTDPTPTPTQTVPDAVREIMRAEIRTANRAAECDGGGGIDLDVVDWMLDEIAAAGFTIAEPGHVYPDHSRMDAYAHGFNDGVEHTANDRPAATADPMPEPTPDRDAYEAKKQAVQNAIENSVESLLDAEVETGRFLTWLADEGYTVVPFAATERPAADTVTISKKSAKQAQIALRVVRIGAGKRPAYIQDLIRDAYDEINAALSAGAGQDAGGGV